MSSKSFERVSPGVPTGGQFAPIARAEAAVSLDATSPNGVQDDTLSAFEDLTPEDAFRAAAESARFWAARCGVDADDVAQDALVSYLSARTRRRAAAENGEDVLLDDEGEMRGFRGGYLNAAARSAALKVMTGGARSEERKAYTEFRRRREALEQAMGREVTGREEDELAERVRLAMPPTRRAREGFHRRTAMVSLDGSASETAFSNRADVLLAASSQTGQAVANPDDFTDDSLGARAEQLLSRGGKANHVAARRLAWDALAEASGAPPVAAGTLPERRAATVRKVAAEAGGPRKLAALWRDGRATPEQEAALFAPFGGSALNSADKHQTADMLSSHAGYAEDLWDSSVLAATVTRAGR